MRVNMTNSQPGLPHCSGPRLCLASPFFVWLLSLPLPRLLPPSAWPLSPCAVFWKLPMLSILRLTSLAFHLSRTIVLCCVSVLKNVFSVWFGVLGVSSRRINVVPGIPS